MNKLDLVISIIMSCLFINYVIFIFKIAMKFNWYKIFNRITSVIYKSPPIPDISLIMDLLNENDLDEGVIKDIVIKKLKTNESDLYNILGIYNIKSLKNKTLMSKIFNKYKLYSNNGRKRYTIEEFDQLSKDPNNFLDSQDLRFGILSIINSLFLYIAIAAGLSFLYIISSYYMFWEQDNSKITYLQFIKFIYFKIILMSAIAVNLIKNSFVIYTSTENNAPMWNIERKCNNCQSTINSSKIFTTKCDSCENISFNSIKSIIGKIMSNYSTTITFVAISLIIAIMVNI